MPTNLIALTSYELEQAVMNAVNKALDQRDQELSSNSQTEKLYTRQEVLELLHISAATLWKHMNSGHINFKKIGRRVFFTETDLKEALEKFRK